MHWCKKYKKSRHSQVERFITKKLIAIVVSKVWESLVMNLPRLNLLLACPNFPSMLLRILSDSKACFFCSLLTLSGGLPKGGPLILIPHYFTPSSVFSGTINFIHMNRFRIITSVVFKTFYLCL